MMLRLFQAIVTVLTLLSSLTVTPDAATAADPAPRLPGDPQRGTEFTNSIGMVLVYVPPDKFQMGSPESELDRFDDEQQHPVELTNGYYIGKFEVTQEQYQAVVGKNPSAFKGERLPVESVGWKEAKEFCRLLSLKEQRADEKGQGDDAYRLPTEAEWEHACRAGTKTPFHFGTTLSPEQANFAFHYVKQHGTVEVGRFPPNAWGLHDMHGNVFEWCEDLYAPNIHENSQPVDPTGPLKGSYFSKVIRGGSWGCATHYCRSAFRDSLSIYQTTSARDNIGFRIALPQSK